MDTLYIPSDNNDKGEEWTEHRWQRKGDCRINATPVLGKKPYNSDGCHTPMAQMKCENVNRKPKKRDGVNQHMMMVVVLVM
jgi:hypothetical protein